MFSRAVRPEKADVLADSHPLERYAYDIRDVMSHILAEFRAFWAEKEKRDLRLLTSHIIM